MKTFLLMVSLVLLFSCGDTENNEQIHSRKSPDKDTISKVASQPNNEEVIEEDLTKNTLSIDLDSSNKIEIDEVDLDLIKTNTVTDYSMLKYPTLVIIDKLCDEVISYKYNSKTKTIEKNRAFPDCPSNDKFQGVFVTKLPSNLSDSVRTYLELEVDKILKPIKDKSRITYLK